MLKSKSIPLVLVVVCALFQAAATPQTQTQSNEAKSSASEDRLLSALDKSGYEYRKVDKGVWVIDLKGKHLSEIRVIASAVEDSILLQADIADRKSLKLNEGLLVKLLELNHQYDEAKIALAEKRLYARADLHTKLVDGEELGFLINQVAVLADEAYQQAKPFVGSAK